MNDGITQEEFVKSWNSVIKFLLAAQTAWEKHQRLMLDGRNTDNLTTYEAQNMAALVFNRATTFFKAMETFWPYCEINGGLRAFTLPLPQTNLKPKEIKNDE
jgi:hypothetical protein